MLGGCNRGLHSSSPAAFCVVELAGAILPPAGRFTSRYILSKRPAGRKGHLLPVSSSSPNFQFHTEREI